MSAIPRSAISSNGIAASRSTPLSLAEATFDKHLQATTTCCSAADAGSTSTLATRLHEVCQTAGALAELAKELHRLDAGGSSLDHVELSGICNISQEVAEQLRSIRSAVLQRRKRHPSPQAAPPEPPSKRKRATGSPKQCVKCHYTETPVWRNGPQGPQSLCNPCGLLYAKKVRAAAAAR